MKLINFTLAFDHTCSNGPVLLLQEEILTAISWFLCALVQCAQMKVIFVLLLLSLYIHTREGEKYS